MAGTRDAASAWGRWNCDDWSGQLVEFFFAQSGIDEDDPVTTMVVTPETLKAVSGDPAASESEVRDAFVSAVRRRLGETARSLCADASDYGDWTPGLVYERPHFVSHLVLACLAASELNADLVEESGFQAHLDALAGAHVRHHNPRCLPELWRTLTRWLDNCRARDIRMRELIVPDPGGYTRIGQTVKLAFPARRDQEILVSALGEVGLRGFEPPFDATLRTVGQHRRRFSERFQFELSDFEARLRAGEAGISRSPFWQAIREAALRSGSYARGRRRNSYQLVGGAHEGSLWLLIVAPRTETELPSGWRCEKLPAEEYAGWSDYVTASDAQSAEQGADDAVDALFAGSLELTPLSKFIDQGVLVFSDRGGGIYELETFPPKQGQVLLMLSHDQPAAQVVESLARTGQSDVVARECTWSGWLQIGPFRAIPDVWESVGLRDQAWCLQESASEGRIRLRRRITASGGILGRKEVLPDVVSDGADSVTVSLADDERFELEPTDDGTFRFPTRDFEGSVAIEATRGDSLLDRRSFRFVLGSANHAYRTPREPSDWRVEGVSDVASASDESGAFSVHRSDLLDPRWEKLERVFLGPAVGQLSLDARSGFDWAADRGGGEWTLIFVGTSSRATPPHGKVSSKSNCRFWRKLFVSAHAEEFDAEIGDVLRDYSGLARSNLAITDCAWAAVEIPRQVVRESASPIEACEVFEDVIAAIGTGRSGVREGEIVELARDVFGLSSHSPSPWDVLRAWQETGRLSAMAPIRWRGRRYFPIRPCLALRGQASRGVVGLLWGLTTTGLRIRAVQAAEECGITATERLSLSPYVSPAIAFHSPSEANFAPLSRALDLGPTIWVRDPQSVLRDPVTAVAKNRPPPGNYKMTASWDEGTEAFNSHFQPRGECLERWTRPDASEFFVERAQNGEVEWWTYARNWALLAHHRKRDVGPFVSREASLCRGVHHEVYLPLELARVISAIAPLLPGPVRDDSGHWSYHYAFNAAGAPDPVLSGLGFN